MVQTTRRSTRGATAKGAQSKIAFGTKVTKRTTSIGKDTKTTEPAKSKLSHVEPADNSKKPDVVALDDDSNDAKVKVGAKGDTGKLSGAEREAEAVKPDQIKTYWRVCENERIAPRVHQEDVSLEEKILRLFDMSSKYGPCIGITRLARWHRANRIGLKPPIEVLAVLLQEQKKGNKDISTKAHLEDLLATKSVIEN